MADSAVTKWLIYSAVHTPSCARASDESEWTCSCGLTEAIELSRQTDRVIEWAKERDYHKMHIALDKLESLEKQP